jgi:hypothetical protein
MTGSSSRVFSSFGGSPDPGSTWRGSICQMVGLVLSTVAISWISANRKMKRSRCPGGDGGS